MTKQLDVLLAVKAMLAAALPGVDVVGLDGEDVAPDRVGDNGRCGLEAGDPGDPEIDLSPVTYNYSHSIPVDLSFYATDELTALKRVDAGLDQIADEIEADRTLGGVVDYLDATAPVTEDDAADGAAPLRTARITIIAIYSSSRPL